MSAPRGTTILGLGHYVPEHRVANAEIEARLSLEAGWIWRRTGIRERRYAAEDEALSDMAVAAGAMALQRTDLEKRTIALVILATSTPDHLLPPSAPLVAHRLGLGGVGAIDMAGACAGFLYALAFADGFARINNAAVLVIAANILSRRTNRDDRSSVILFGDGAGAAVVAPSAKKSGVLGSHFASDGAAYDLIQIPAGGSRQPFDAQLATEATLMRISDGRAVFAKASAMMAHASRKALDMAGVTVADVDRFVPHQANARIMRATREKLGIDEARMLSSVADCANSSAATIPLTLSLATEAGPFKSGTTLLMCAAGAGLTGGAIVYRL